MAKYLQTEKIKEFLRFCVVGVLCTLIDAGIFYLMQIWCSYQISLVSGYLLSLIVNYYLTIYWTFASRPLVGNTIGFLVAHVFNLFVVRMGLMYLFVEICGISDKIAFLPTITISVISNFLILRVIISRDRV